MKRKLKLILQFLLGEIMATGVFAFIALILWKSTVLHIEIKISGIVMLTVFWVVGGIEALILLVKKWRQ